MKPSHTGLWRHADFMRLWVGQTISTLGSHVGGGAIRFTAILLLGATPIQLGILSAAALVPTLLLGLFAGVWVDRLPRRPILMVADIGRAVLLLSVPLAYLLGSLRIEQLYVVVALMGALSVFFEVAYHSLLPSVVRRDQLVEGNSKLGISDSVAEIVGPPLGGTLVQLISAPFAVLIDAVSFLGSAVAIWRIRAVETVAESKHARESVVRELLEGVRAVVQAPVLRALLGAAVTQNLAGSIIGTLYDLYLIRELGLSPALVGLTIGAGGVGALFGAMITERVVGRFGLGPTMIGTRVVGLIGLLIPFARGPVSVALAMVMLAQLADVAMAIYLINTLSLRQSVTPDHLLGRVNASFNVVVTTAGLIGALLAGVLAQMIGVRWAIALGVLGVSLSALWLYYSPIRSFRATGQHAGNVQ